MRKIFLSILLFLAFSPVFATHITGGEMIYRYLGPGAAPGTSSYKITLKLFRDENSGAAAMPADVFIGIFDRGTNQQFPGAGLPYDVLISNGTGGVPVPVDPAPACMTNAPNLRYNVGIYDFVVDLPDNADGYICCYQTCCRTAPLINVFNSQTGQGEGSSYVCTIPGFG